MEASWHPPLSASYILALSSTDITLGVYLYLPAINCTFQDLVFDCRKHPQHIIPHVARPRYLPLHIVNSVTKRDDWRFSRDESTANRNHLADLAGAYYPLTILQRTLICNPYIISWKPLLGYQSCLTMLIEPSSFPGFYHKYSGVTAVVSSRTTPAVIATDVTSTTTATASCTALITSAAETAGTETVATPCRRHYQWLDVWRRILFACLPQTRHPSLPKTNSSSSVNLTADTCVTTFTILASPIYRPPTSVGMPYTPPSCRSPASSAPASPDVSRRSSYSAGSGSSRPMLPRSSSYITRHRRTPSAPSAIASPQPSAADACTPDITPPGTSDDLKGMLVSHSSPSVRQSPPPVVDSRAMPPGAVISPPESSSEDEGQGDSDKRGRQIENLRELKEAISIIPQHRESSPNRTSPGDLLVLPSQINGLGDEQKPAPKISLPTLDTAVRKISHTRSATDSHIFLPPAAADSSVAVSEENSGEDEPFVKKPQMVRKKSGELVRPALRPAAHRRPSSMPGTPTFSKAVHFDSHLEHVRHFLQVDRPLAVSANTSPNDNYESDTEYPFGSNAKRANRPQPFELEIVINNFPPETPIRKAQPVRLERLWMSPDQKSLIGSVAVANLAFNKLVVCRFTFDYWKTTSEVVAEFMQEIRPKYSELGHDRFQFTIKLSDLANLESKTLYLCMRYNVNGQDYWDNNNNVNFQVDFRKKVVGQEKGRGAQTSSRSSNTLPRSNRRANSSTTARPKSMPVGALDDFGHNSRLTGFNQPIHEFLGEIQPTGVRLKSSKSATTLPSDNLANKLPTPSGQAFANRYDFGASLNAAMQAHKASVVNRRSDGLYMKPHKRASFGTTATETPKAQNPPAAAPQPKPTLAPTSGTDAASSNSITSSSYEEILNKYCFVRTHRDFQASHGNSVTSDGT